MQLKYTLSACVDCILFVANDDIPEDRAGIAIEIADHLGADARHLVNCDGCDEAGEFYRDASGHEVDMDHPEYHAFREDWFSWSSCECCGSTLDGMRNRLAVLQADGADSP